MIRLIKIALHFISSMLIAQDGCHLQPLETNHAITEIHPSAHISNEVSAEVLKIPKSREKIIRLQIFLDQQNFGPGVLDGKMGTFTKMAVAAYNKKHVRRDNTIEQLHQDAAKQVPILYATAIVPEAINEFVDAKFQTGSDRNYQSSRVNMPYRSVAEFMAERYHTTIDFLKRINGPEIILNAGFRTAMRVPNVEPFRIENMAPGRTHKFDSVLSNRWAVIDTSKFQIRVYEPIAQNDSEPTLQKNQSLKNTNQTDSKKIPKQILLSDSPVSSPPRAIIVDADQEPPQTQTIHDEHRAVIVAAYPITPGKKEFIRFGSWKMKNAIEFPTWRFDDALLKTGQRSTDSLTIPAGPNSPVGVLWLGLSRPGIGIHGTDQPDRIGRSRSAGCIRMANWDVVKLPHIIRPGATVIIK
jgi:lipoprotein-anchoring transpeptidase ErfK/SrfK